MGRVNYSVVHSLLCLRNLRKSVIGNRESQSNTYIFKRLYVISTPNIGLQLTILRSRGVRATNWACQGPLVFVILDTQL